MDGIDTGERRKAGLQGALDAILAQAVDGAPDGRGRVPGVVAMLTNRERTLYAGTAGTRRLGDDEPMSADSVFALFSCTKAVTVTAVLQCVEEGLLDLDAPLGAVVPAIDALPVIEGFDEAGQPCLRAPRSRVTLRMALLHTAGFAYEQFDATYARLAREHGLARPGSGRRAVFEAPLLFDPGTRWQYGIGVDWAGQAVEAVRGQRLGAVMADRIFAPLGMTDTGFVRDPAMRARTAGMHARKPDGRLERKDDFAMPDAPEVDMGGGGLYGTAPDYIRFIRMWLDEGRTEDGRPVLQPATVAMALANGLRPPQTVTALPGVLAHLSNEAEFFPGLPKGWALAGMTVEADAPTGRPAGAVGWAGLGNLYYWIDHRAGLGGLWFTQILPFIDPVSFPAFLAFETAAQGAAATGRAA